MELIGEETKIQDLFRELRVEDARFAPRFSAVWNRAEARVNRPSRLFKFAFAAATVLLAFALFSLPWWSKRWPSTQQQNEVALAPPALAEGRKLGSFSKSPRNSPRLRQ